ncbi:MAG: D-glycero-beta-D-manno-heptose-7-phosphate kinase [Verrucomicrobia bacterium]|nr:D-glycero-beta-D-manno-heptose-7-phosphate kinase [Verrucomicrobiota bacterium]
MVKLAGAFSQFKPFTVLVIGDFLYDTYTTGRVKRISPEAPVPVMEVQKQESRPGGAGNVVLNLTTLGAKVFAAGRIGADYEGEELKERLNAEGADISALLIEPGYRTPVKNRLIADSQQLLRVDFETVTPLLSSVEQKIILELRKIIPQTQIVAISDYGKGFLTNSLISAIIQISREAKVPVIVDPKGSDFTKYKKASVLKPNLSEAYAAAKMPLSTPLDAIAQEILRIAEVDTLLITRSEAGMSIFDRNGSRKDFPVRSKEVIDVTGAGDTVLSIICLALASGLDITQAAQLGNIAAGISIERLGCVQVTLSELAQRLLEFDCDTKVFDESHTYALHQVLKGKRYSLLVLQNGQSITNALFRTVRELSDREHQLIIYINDPHPKEEFIHLLSSLHAVDTIILQSENLKNLCQAIHPHEIFVLEGDEVSKLDQAKDLIAALVSQKSESLI